MTLSPSDSVGIILFLDSLNCTQLIICEYIQISNKTQRVSNNVRFE
jgi:hypothetical protein